MRWILALAAAAMVAVTATADLDLLLLHVNDVHSRFEETDVKSSDHCPAADFARGECYGGVARIAEVVRTERQLAADKGLPSLFVVAGDIFQGTPYFTFFKWQVCAEVVKKLRPDIMTLGNHEFDDSIKTLVSYLTDIKIPTVLTNLNMTEYPTLSALVLPSRVFTINGTKVGFVGYLSTDCPSIANTGRIKFMKESQPIRNEIKKLRDSGVNIVIALGHSGIDVDRIVAREVEDIDLIISSHSHTFLCSGPPPSIEIPYGPYPFYETNVKNNKPVPIITAYAFSKYIGKVHLRFDSKGDLTSIDGSPILLDRKIKQDPSMLTLVNKWKPLVTEITNVTVGRTFVDLSSQCGLEECNFGNLIADSYVYYNVLKNHNNKEYWTDSPIGIIQSGGIRTTIKYNSKRNGYITLGQLTTAIPFMRKLVKVTISGSTLKEVFEHSVTKYGFPLESNRFLQVSGVQIEYDLSQNPGSRVSSIYLRCGKCVVPKFEPLILNANYTILLNGFLARGGDNYWMFKNTVKKNVILDVDDYNVTAVYMKAISPIITGIEGRIKFKSHSTKNEKSTASNITYNTPSSRLQLLLIVIFSTLLFCYH
ncbi:Hypothetical protein CINCED_3A005982 [Cinara cedri]|uniref:5'-nucleotidase n=1 Tax=Cinara cedri TaxID=506608 RepID=A0A5E4MAA0_9HEMI|nr:Hypothetical protein CINCED_3A005982 [Cinara cedri]